MKHLETMDTSDFRLSRIDAERLEVQLKSQMKREANSERLINKIAKVLDSNEDTVIVNMNYKYVSFYCNDKIYSVHYKVEADNDTYIMYKRSITYGSDLYADIIGFDQVINEINKL